ncbi:MAG: hypothetical protein M0024_14795 [Nitrospiraceae bacterium]|nr:hypothetical protein [Nitrospiraceae bacterium]
MHRRRKSLFIRAFIVIAVIFTVRASADAHDLVWPGEKLKTMFPQAVSFEQKNLFVSEEQRVAIEKVLGSGLPAEDLKPSVYFAITRDRPDTSPRKAAAIIFMDARGQGGKIEIGLAVSGKGKLIRLHIFENMESASLTGTAFLKQFEGKERSDKFRVGSDIIAPPETVKSAQAIASGARRGLILINELFKKK